MMTMAKTSLIQTHRCQAVALFAATACVLPTSVCAAEAVPDWVYEAVGQLEAEGYVDLAGKLPQDHSREELVQIVAQGLHQIDRVQHGTRAEEYGRLTSLALRDEARVKLYREQERMAQKELADAQAEAEQAEARLVRESLRGTNRLEVMKPLQERAAEARLRLQIAARDHALAKMRREKREIALAKVEERKKELASGMDMGDGTAEVTDKTMGRSAPVATAGDDTEAEPLVSSNAMETAARLRAAFADDLALMGYTDEENANQQLYPSRLLPERLNPKLKIDAELRADVSNSTGIESGDGHTRLRLRVFPDYNIDDNWHAIGMLEYKKILSGNAGKGDGKLVFDRYYLTGNIGIVKTTVGVFGASLAEGNICDSKFKGVRLSAGVPVRYTAYYGSMDRAHRVATLSASYDTPFYGVDVGMYRFDKINNAVRNIYMGNFRSPLGAFDFGAMILVGKDKVAGNGTGYVLTLAKKDFDWQPGALTYWLKYYRQPSSTYVSHTMNGMADYMSFDSLAPGPRRGGFRGWSAGLLYTIQKDLMFGLEYYDLVDLDTAERSRTIWASLTGYFRNYGDL